MAAAFVRLQTSVTHQKELPMRCKSLITLLTLVLGFALFAGDVAGELKLHNIFSSHMVIQRDKPIKIWGWAKPGETVAVRLGEETAEATVQPAAPVEVFGLAEDYAGLGRWEVTFAAREASTDSITLIVTSGDEKVKMEDILIGDVWVMSGQSNMAFPLGKVNGSDIESAQANLPLLRLFSITGNEQGTPQDDIRPETITTGGWVVSSPETAREFSAIGYVFGANIQRALQIPIGVIKNARGGASIESIVPAHKFEEDPLAKRYADYVRQRMAEFDPEAEADRIWEAGKARAQRKNLPEPERPDPENLRSWNVPGKSPSDMASVHNGMFGVFKGFNIKGVLFHQGFNNALGDKCRPKRYRVLMKLMVEGWREDFNDPNLPVGVIGFCAGGETQNEENFETQSRANGPYIREAQRLGLADVGDPENTVFIPAYDVRIPGLHPKKKREHGWRAARWALSKIYGVKGVYWDSAELISAEPRGDVMVLTFDARVHPDDRNSIVEGFSIAGEDGKFYMAHARYQDWGENSYWTHGHRTIHVWSPLVEKPVAVRYGWATSPMGNLKCNGHQDLPFTSFRTDDWDLPESDDPEVSLMDSAEGKLRKEDAEQRLEYRRAEEAKHAVEILERIKTLGKLDAAEDS
jgi:sialate O-acetylesterase